MEKDKTLKKGEKVKNERNELVKMLKDEPQRLVFKTLGTYATDFPHLKELVHFDSKATDFMLCRICYAKKEYNQAFVLARRNNRRDRLLDHMRQHKAKNAKRPRTDNDEERRE